MNTNKSPDRNFIAPALQFLSLRLPMTLSIKQADELNAKKLAIHALASQLSKSASSARSSVSISDIEQAGLGKGTSQRLAHNDPRNHGSRFGWLFGAAVPQKTDKSSLAANDNVNKLAAIQSDQNASDTASEADDIDEVTILF